MKLRILTLIALTLYGQSTLAMSEAMKQELADSRKIKETAIAVPTPAPTPAAIQAIDNQRAILIFLDTNEKKELGAVSISLITALTQEAGPIIATQSLLHNIFATYGKPPTSFNPQTPVREFNKAQQARNTAIEKDILLHVFTFDPKAWTIKKINEYFYLLIPHTYSKQLNINAASLANFTPTKELTKDELILGLKVNHMETVTIETFATPLLTSSSFIKALYQPSTNTSPIFCTHKDYLDSQYAQPIWSIYMDGHGAMGSYIVDMTLDQFKNVLDFLENKITTKVLIYRSCYAAGTNNEIIYKDSESGVAKTYSFVIITVALTDAPVSALWTIISDPSNPKKATLKNECDFKKFLQELSSSSPLDYEALLSTIFAARERLTKTKQPWSNAPQIKLPGVEWFSVLDDKKNIATIGSILGKTREAGKPLDVVTFFKTDPKAILLYAQDIPFELVIDSEKMETVISMIPGNAVHTIKKISSSTKKTPEILDWFMSMRDLKPLKIFFIKEIQGNNQEEKLTDVIIANDSSSNWHAFFKVDNILFAGDAATGSKATDRQTRIYNDLLARAQGKIPQPERFVESLKTIIEQGAAKMKE